MAAEELRCSQLVIVSFLLRVGCCRRGCDLQASGVVSSEGRCLFGLSIMLVGKTTTSKAGDK